MADEAPRAEAAAAGAIPDAPLDAPLLDAPGTMRRESCCSTSYACLIVRGCSLPRGIFSGSKLRRSRNARKLRGARPKSTLE
eukprot:6184728-Pleurochrysis_carterae.AAC.1